MARSDGRKKEVLKLVRAVRANGYSVELSPASGHWKIKDRQTGRTITTIAATPSDYRFWRQSVSQLVSLGVLAEDPKKAGQHARPKRERPAGVSPPPPLSPLPASPTRKEVSLSRFTDRRTRDSSRTPPLDEHVRTLTRVAISELHDLFKVEPRKGRMMGHGACGLIGDFAMAQAKIEGREGVFDDIKIGEGGQRRTIGNRVRDAVEGYGTTSLTREAVGLFLRAWENKEKILESMEVVRTDLGKGIRLEPKVKGRGLTGGVSVALPPPPAEEEPEPYRRSTPKPVVPEPVETNGRSDVNVETILDFIALAAERGQAQEAVELGKKLLKGGK